ncbi:MAG: DNA topoisomerase IB [candidate division SR1 bacterium]|nr:DNA topoisomerase IB [candidate division SR1 bacterium]
MIKSEVSASEAGLIYISDLNLGITRKLKNNVFHYCNSNGKKINDSKILSRIKSLGIPPAYRDVWICPEENGHIQAIGYDIKGRKQYRYHPKWRSFRSMMNHKKMIEFGLVLPEIRSKVLLDLAGEGLKKEKILASIVRLIDITLIRVGNDEYARENDSYGVTTLRKHHIKLLSEISFEIEFKGKSHKFHHIIVRDKRVTRIIIEALHVPGYELFKYLDSDDRLHKVDSDDVNNYIRSISGGDFTAKDFRTWWGTVFTLMALQKVQVDFDRPLKVKCELTKVLKFVSDQLGNTPSVCRKFYIYPGLIDAYLEGELSKIIQEFSLDKSYPKLSKEEQLAFWFFKRV